MHGNAIREALRADLAGRGFRVQSDTHGSRGLYLMGKGDLALALFEFHASAADAIDAMYQGAWTAGLPPRFAVLPEAAASEDSFELLEQMRIIPLLHTQDAVPRFVNLGELLSEHL